MPKSLRPVVKLEDGEAKGQEADGQPRLQEEAGAGRAVQRRRVGEAGDADEAQLLRLNMELQAQAIQGMERARVLGEELLQAKARVAELSAELKVRDEALRSIMQSKDTVIQSKDAVLQAKDLLLQAKDSEIRLLHADIARLSAGCAAGGAARQPAPAPPAHVDAAAQGEALFQEGQRLYGEQRFSEAAERWVRAALLQHAPSHAHLSDMLICGKPGVAQDYKRGFKLAKAGAALGCAHSKGALGCCYIDGYGVAEDEARGLALGREALRRAAALGSIWLDGATGMVMAALRRTLPRLRDSSVLQRIRGMHPLSTSWASCSRTAMVLRRTEQRPSDGTASPPRRGMHPLKPVWRDCARSCDAARSAAECKSPRASCGGSTLSCTNKMHTGTKAARVAPWRLRS
jgi:hypothetical protein